MKTIQLTQGKIAFVDDKDFERVNKFKWFAHKRNKTMNWYARRQSWEDGKQTTILMHRYILGVPKYRQIDHINGDGLDNRRNNIRLCAATQNARNQHGIYGMSKYKGVYFHCERWVARIRIDGVSIHLGRFRSEDKAAEAYDIAALKHFGEFAKTNKMLGVL